MKNGLVMKTFTTFFLDSGVFTTLIRTCVKRICCLSSISFEIKLLLAYLTRGFGKIRGVFKVTCKLKNRLLDIRMCIIIYWSLHTSEQILNY